MIRGVKMATLLEYRDMILLRIKQHKQSIRQDILNGVDIDLVNDDRVRAVRALRAYVEIEKRIIDSED